MKVFNEIKRILRFILNKKKFSKFCRFDYSVMIDSQSFFEGMNQVHSNTSFKGKMGYGSYIANDCSFSADIGRFTSIGPYVRCNHGRHPYSFPFATTAPCFFSLNPFHSQNGSTFATEQLYDEFALYDKNREIAVKIGSDCWIGEGVFLVGGIKIGNGAVLLAHAVVTKDVPDFAIVGGVPAKIINNRYDSDTITFLQKVEWWNNDKKWFEDHWKLLSNIEEMKKYYKTKE